MDHDTAPDIPQQLARRAAAAHRLPPLESGSADPWCSTASPAAQANLQAARRAWNHLNALGLLDAEHWQTNVLAEVAAA